MSAAEATAEVFITAFKSLKPRQREAVLERMLEDKELSAGVAGTLLLESCRQPSRSSFRWSKSFSRSGSAADELAVTRKIANKFEAKEWEW